MQFTPGDPILDLPLTPVTTFAGYCAGAATNGRDGELTLRISVPDTDKYAAMRTTDHPGRMFKFTVEMPDLDAWDTEP